MRRPRGLTAALCAGLGLALVLGLSLFFRRDLLVEYHAFRLQEAASLGEAQPWLERLTLSGCSEPCPVDRGAIRPAGGPDPGDRGLSTVVRSIRGR